MEIEWSKPARDQLDKALDFILDKGFIPYAFELNDNILSRIENLTENYNIYPVDRYKVNNNSSYIMLLKLMNIAYRTGLPNQRSR